MNSKRITLFVEVLLPLPIPRLYTYRVPLEMNDIIKERIRVVVQFGARKIYSGLIINIKETPPKNYTANYILDVLDENELIDITQQKFWFWMSEYYMCHPGEVMAAALPAGFRLKSESIVFLASDFKSILELEDYSEIEADIIALLGDMKPQKISDIQKKLNKPQLVKHLKSLYSRGILLFEEEVKENYIPKIEKWYRIPDHVAEDDLSKEMDKLQKKAVKQFEALLLILGSDGSRMMQKQLYHKHGVTGATLKSLIKKGWLIKEELKVDRVQFAIDEVGDYKLNQEQSHAVLSIKDSFKNAKPALLNGVTGSGKTYVYVELIKECIKNKQQALFLLPEVAITEVIVARISKYFKRYAVWYNYYSQQERTEIYSKLKAGEIDVLIGARSALFAPFKNLGLIVVDEEHENSYKQFEKRPHYNGRDASLYLAKLCNANIVLGSATPSFESLYAVKQNTMLEVRLENRFTALKSLNIELVKPPEGNKNKTSIFSAPLLKSIDYSLKNNQQVILFQNKKGYVPYLSCDICGYTDQCKNCDISLTYYKFNNLQRCSYCSTKYELTKICKACGSHNLSMRGYGTERIAEECEIIFPKATIQRFDNESIRKKGDFDRIISNFHNQKIDILVGTQLLSKGIDFTNVGTVGVADADALLKFPDFRSHERAYQLLKQVGGRAGDSQIDGHFVLQTQQPDHPVFQHLLNNSYHQLYENEISVRNEFKYPPFSKMLIISIKHKDFKQSKSGASLAFQIIAERLKHRIEEPYTPMIGRVRNMYIHCINIKMSRMSDNHPKIKEFISQSLIQMQTQVKGIRVDIDVDPT